jgi:hypothetical protein
MMITFYCASMTILQGVSLANLRAAITRASSSHKNQHPNLFRWQKLVFVEEILKRTSIRQGNGPSKKLANHVKAG